MQPEYTRFETDTLGPVNAKQLPRWAGLATFARVPRLDEVPDADIKIVGAPFDAGVTFRPGARSGPAHVRESSRLLRTYNPSLKVMPFADAQIVDAGDIPMNPMSIEEAVASVEATSDELRKDGSRLVMIGGDHTIALPNLRSLARTHGPITVVHFDAHLDTWGEFYGAEINHGSPFRVASEEGLLDETSCLHVGIRGPIYGEEDLRDDERLGFAIISTDEIEVEGVEAAIARMLRRVGDNPIYLSIDIDVLDPAFAPGTGTLEAGGLSSRELIRLVRAFRNSNVVGAEVVEVLPVLDHGQITGVAAAHVVFELLSVMAPQVGRTKRLGSAE